MPLRRPVAGTVNVTVNTAGGTSAISAADEFTYLAAPTVTAISPSSGPLAGGDTVTITGTGFTGATAVKFGSTDAAAYSIVSDTEITATSPASPAGTVDITVTTPGGTSATAPADQFTYNPPPDVTCISPTSGTTAGGTMVTICGTGFEGVTDVKFGGVSAIWFSGDTSTQVRAQPDGGAAGTVDVTVISPNGTSAVSPADQFTFVADPMVIAATTTPVPTSTQNTSAGSDDTPGGTNVQGQAVVVAPPVTSSVDVNVGGNSAVSQVTVTGSGVGEMIVTGTVQSGPGPGMPAAPGEVYQYLTLVPARYSTITGAEIVFSVPESWFAEHTLSPGAIALNRYANSQWNTLPTRILKTENGHVFFSSASPGFSYFAIIGISRSSADVGSEEPAQEQTPVALSHNNVTQAAEKPAPAATTAAPVPPTSKAEPPVFLIVLAFIGIGGVALVAVGIVARRWWIRRQNPALFRKME